MNEVLWMYADAVSDPETFRRAFDSMPFERRQKIRSFRFERDRQLSLCAGLLLCEGLKRAGVPNAGIAYGPYGKPYLRDRDDVFFNLSHGGRIAAIAVSDKPVGIDVEPIRPFGEDVLRRVFLPEELAAAPGCDRERFYTVLWTVKESIMKLFGTGLSLDPADIRVSFGERVAAHCADFDCEPLRFLSRSLDDHILTVCSYDDPFFDLPEQFEP